MATPTAPQADSRQARTLESVVIRFAGDSGDGMQLTGTQFTNTSAVVGNDLTTLPDFPAEIRAPAGTLAGVSGFQINFASRQTFTPGDELDVLVAMNPAALKANLHDLRRGGLLVANTGQFSDKNLQRAGYERNPLEDGSLDAYELVPLDISKLTQAALEGTGLSAREMERSKNFFTLGLLYWLYNRPLEPTLNWIDQKFAGKDTILDANGRALKAGHAYGETAELFQNRYRVPAREAVAPGTYVNITGNRGLALGLATVAARSNLDIFLGSYPITPASDLLHELSGFKEYGVLTFQAEDEIAAVTAALGASFGGSLGVTSTSGPGLALKAEAVGLGVMTELPLLVIDVQRGGPSTGLPTKTEQADLLQAMYGRNGEAPVPIIAPRTPGDCYWAVIEAARLATRYMVPVLLLSDGYLANGSEPWRLPDVDALPVIDVRFAESEEAFQPYRRDPETLARPWARPGTPGLEHRIGGLEKQDVSGSVSYDPANHEHMVRTRAAKVAGMVRDIPPAEVEGDEEGELLVVGWGSTYGSIAASVRDARAEGKRVSHLHLRHLNPMPENVEHVLRRFERILVPELNAGQLVKLLRSEFALNVRGVNKIQGHPFRKSELRSAIDEALARPPDADSPARPERAAPSNGKQS